MSTAYRVLLGVRSNQIAGDPAIPPPAITEEDLQRARYEKDQAAAEAARLKRELDEAKKSVPSDEQRARWAELETKEQAAEEERARKAGEFDNWRTQVNERHQRELDGIRQERANEEARRAALEGELKSTLIAREFADAVDLFGPAGKTVLLPAVAQSYFAPHVEVEAADPANKTDRRVIVKDVHGATIVDPKTGRPMPFAKAMNEVIEAHPQKAYLLRGSGKVGANSSGGAYDGDGGIDTSRLKAADFQDPKVRDAIRSKMNVAGGLQFGPGFDKLRQQKKRDG